MANEEQIISFINSNIDKNTGKFSNYVLEAAKNSGLIHVEMDKNSKYSINKFKFIETKKVTEVFDHLKKLCWQSQ